MDSHHKNRRQKRMVVIVTMILILGLLWYVYKQQSVGGAPGLMSLQYDMSTFDNATPTSLYSLPLDKFIFLTKTAELP